MKTLDTRHWNLGGPALSIAALGLASAACGPVVEFEGETDGSDGSDTVIEPSESDTDIDPMQCLGPADCDDDEDCIGGECVPEDDYDCYDSGDCYCVYGHCSPPYYYDCYDDEDCDTGELCQGGYCDPVQNLPACGDSAQSEEVLLPLPIPTGDPVASLSFVDLDDAPGQALIVGMDEGGFVVQPDTEPAALPSLPGPALDAAAADFDGDGAVDLAILHEEGLTVLYGFGTAEQARTDAPASSPLVEAAVFGPQDALPRLVVRDADNATGEVHNLAERTPGLEPIAEDFANAGLATFDDGAGTIGFVLNAFANVLSRVYYDPEAFLELGGYARNSAVRSLATGALAGGPISDAVWATVHEDWTLLELAIDTEQFETRALYFGYGQLGIGDFDGNGSGDVLTVGEGGFAVMPGDAEWGVTCFVQGPLLSAGLLAVGDIDGDGMDEFATTTQTGAPVVYDVSWSP